MEPIAAQPVIDTHLHVWLPSQLQYHWLTESAGILFRNFPVSEVQPQLKQAGINGSLLVQAANTQEETQFLLQVAAAEASVLGVIGWVPLLQPDAAVNALDELTKNPLFKGVRHLIHEEPDPTWLLQEPVLESLRELARLGLPYEVVGNFNVHLPVALQVAEKIPNLKLVIDHLGNSPAAASPDFKSWSRLMLRAAENPNIRAKISGLGMPLPDLLQWQPSDLQPQIEHAINCFGPERLFCGSDWPVCLLAGGLQKCWQAYKSVLVPALSITNFQKVMGGNAISFYRL